ncbi:RusA family crossover junction endodeoxyribonuclease [Nocardia sp. NPDC004722]
MSPDVTFDEADLRALRPAEAGHIVTLPGDPHPKGRPRFSRGRAYTAEADRDAEARTALLLSQRVSQPLTGNIALTCVFYRRTRRRVDVDNLLKHVMDAANGILWRDDSQCTSLRGVIELDRDNPRTLILIGPHESSLVRT